MGPNLFTLKLTILDQQGGIVGIPRFVRFSNYKDAEKVTHEAVKIANNLEPDVCFPNPNGGRMIQHKQTPAKHVVQPEVVTDNFNNEDFGAISEEMEDEKEILGGADLDYDPRDPRY